MNGIEELIPDGKEVLIMEKITAIVNGRGYHLSTDNKEDVLAFAQKYEEQIKYIINKFPNTSEAEANAYAALVLMADSLKKERSPEDALLFDEMTGKIEVLEERVSILSGEIAVHNEKETSMEAEIERLREENEGISAALSEAEAKVKDTKETLGIELNQAKEKLTESETTIEDVKSALSSANKIIAQLNTEKLTEVAANEALRNELDGARERLEASNKTIAELNGKLTNMEINTAVSDVPEDIKKLRTEKEELEIELAIANEEIEKLKAAPATDAALNEKIAEYEKKIRSLENRSGEMDKLRGILAETEQSVRQKCEEKEVENQKLRNILKNYESSYGISLSKKEDEIRMLQVELDKIKERLGITDEEQAGGAYIQTTFES